MAAIQPEINQVVKQLHRIKSSKLKLLLKFLLVVCQLFAVAPLQSSNVVFRRLHQIWCLFLLVLIYAVNYMQSTVIAQDQPTVEKGMYMSEFWTNCAVVTVTIGSCQYYAEYYSDIPDEILHLAMELQPLQGARNAKVPSLNTEVLYRTVRNLALVITTFLGCYFVVDLLSDNFNLLVVLRSFGAYNVPQVVITLSLAQYVVMIVSITQLYASVNLGLTEVLSSANQDETWCSSVYLSKQAQWYQREYVFGRSHVPSSQLIEKLRNKFADLDKVTSKSMQAFGYIMIFNFLASFFDLSIEYFAIYKWMDRPNEYEKLIVAQKILWIVLHTGRMLFILVPSNGIITEKCRTTFILNDMNSVDQEMETAISAFLMQLMVRNKTESACGIIDLDLMFLGSFVSALSMYVIFLIQIDLGNESLAGIVFSKNLKS